MSIVADVPLQPHKHSISIPSDSHLQSPLGNLALISSVSGAKHTISPAQEKKSRRLMLLDNARRILRTHNVKASKSDKSHRTCTCLAVRFDKTQDIGITLNDNPERSEAGLTNVVTCRSICSCPVCAHRLMMEKAQMVQRALIYAEQNKLIPVMLTLTASHHRWTNLEQFVKSFKAAWKKFSSNRKWKAFKKKFGITHWIAAREVTREAIFNNGWHYHMHILLFLDAGLLLDEIEIVSMNEMFTEYWLHCLKENDLTGLPERACAVTAGDNVGQHYLTKLGLTQDAKGRLDYELTGGENKGHTVWDILYDAAMGDIDAEYLYLEYVEIMKSENWITTSHGLQDLIADVELPATEIDEKEKMSLWYLITQENWNLVVRYHSVRQILHIAARSRDRDKVRLFIEGLKYERERKIPTGIYDD